MSMLDVRNAVIAATLAALSEGAGTPEAEWNASLPPLEPPPALCGIDSLDLPDLSLSQSRPSQTGAKLNSEAFPAILEGLGIRRVSSDKSVDIKRPSRWTQKDLAAITDALIAFESQLTPEARQSIERGYSRAFLLDVEAESGNADLSPEEQAARLQLRREDRALAMHTLVSLSVYAGLHDEEIGRIAGFALARTRSTMDPEFISKELDVEHVGWLGLPRAVSEKLTRELDNLPGWGDVSPAARAAFQVLEIHARAVELFDFDRGPSGKYDATRQAERIVHYMARVVALEPRSFGDYQKDRSARRPDPERLRAWDERFTDAEAWVDSTPGHSSYIKRATEQLPLSQVRIAQRAQYPRR